MKLFTTKLGFLKKGSPSRNETVQVKKKMVELKVEQEQKTSHRYSPEKNNNTNINNNNNNNNNSNNNSMPRQRSGKSLQNDSSSEKAAQVASHDVSKTSRSQEERFQRNFPELACSDDNILIKTYHCALVTDILLQGYLYITSRWFCFYSKLFGKKKLIKIPLSLVLDVSKKKTAKFIPNAVGVTTLNKEYLFGSLLSRDNTYRVMSNTWQAYKAKSKENGSTPDSEMSETNEELVSLDSHNTIANHSETTSYEESFSNVEEDYVDSVVAKVKEETPLIPVAPDNGRCKNDVPERPPRRKAKKSFSPFLDIVGYLLKMSSPSKTSIFLVIASILTIFLLISAFVLSCQLSNLEMLFNRIITRSNGMPAASENAGDGGDLALPQGERGEDEDCETHKENVFLHNLREISTMHHQLLNQINKILTVLQRTTLNSIPKESDVDDAV